MALAWFGDLDDGERVMAPMRALGPPIVDWIAPMSYTALQALTDEPNPWGMRNYWSAGYVNTMSTDLVSALVAATEAKSSPLSAVIVTQMGEAVNTVPENATAFPPRAAAWLVHPVGMWADPAERRRRDGVGAQHQVQAEAVRERRQLPQRRLPAVGQATGAGGLRCRQVRAPGRDQGALRPGQRAPPRGQHRASPAANHLGGRRPAVRGPRSDVPLRRATPRTPAGGAAASRRNPGHPPSFVRRPHPRTSRHPGSANRRARGQLVAMSESLGRRGRSTMARHCAHSFSSASTSRNWQSTSMRCS